MIVTRVIEESFSMMSLEKFVFSPASMGLDAVNQGNPLRTPKAPCAEVYESESILEALPMDLLSVQFVTCTMINLGQYFMYLKESEKLYSKGDDKGHQIPSPNVPKAPRRGPKARSKMRQITDVLF
ncbi:hypothetical protein Ancab_026626 [Ancistrocladus abbreviatus]